ncbi:hypothetical protein FRC01_012179, partial [Tulasnella sp. 417]
GLIGNSGGGSVESESDDELDARSGRVTSMMTDESFHLPDWGSTARLPPQQEEEEPDEEVSYSQAENPTSAEIQEPPAPTNGAQTEVAPSSPIHAPSRHSIASSADDLPLQPAPTPLADPDGEPEADAAPPQDVEGLHSAELTSDPRTPLDEAEFESNEPPSAPDAQSPAMSTFPGSGSEAGGSYYEEDLDIYDNYRYSRFSMMSRKSRKSQVNMSFPDPRSMPSLGDAIGSFPLPPPLNTARSVLGKNDSSDRLVSSPKSASSFSQSPKKFDTQTSPKRFDFSPQPIQPLIIPARKQLTLDTGAPSSPSNGPSLVPNASSPLSPTLLTSRSAQFASSLRQQIEEAERNFKEDEIEDAEAQESEPENDAEPTLLTSAFRGDSEVFLEEDFDDHPTEPQPEGEAPVDQRMSSSSAKALGDEPSSSSRPSSEVRSERAPTPSITPTPTSDATPAVDGMAEARRMSNLPEQSGEPKERDPETTDERISPADLALAQLEGRKSLSAATHASPEERKPRETLSPMDTTLAQLEGRKSPVPPSASLSPEETAALASQFSIENPSGQFLSPSGRRLTFLPHPNAPKPLQAPSQPSIYTQTQPQQQARPPPSPGGSGGPQRPPLLAILNMALAHYRNPPPPIAGRPPPRATIHGRCKQNLANATGPVRIDWFLDNGNGPPPPEEIPRSPAIVVPGFGLP